MISANDYGDMGLKGQRGMISKRHKTCVVCIINLCLGILSISYSSSLVHGQEVTPTAVLIADDLDVPLFVTHAPNDFNRIFIVEKGGTIRILKNGTLLPTPFLDISSVTTTRSESGLLGLAFHPNYEQNGFFYVYYVTGTFGVGLGLRTIIARFTASENPDVAILDSQTVVLMFALRGNIHNGGWIGFSPINGFLYVSVGDGAIVGWQGRILRIDVNGDDWPDVDDRNYAIPPSNPTISGVINRETWACGLRNPWRCAFDSLTGDFFIADVGEDSVEEVNFQPSTSSGGEDYEWPSSEGASSDCCSEHSCRDPLLRCPIYQYDHTPNEFRSRAAAIIGGEVYRGNAIPTLQAAYFFSDLISGDIWTLTQGAQGVQVTDVSDLLCPGPGQRDVHILSFGLDAFGEVYFSTPTEVYKIVPDTGIVPPFELKRTSHQNGQIDARQPFKPDGTRPTSRTKQVEFVFTTCTSKTLDDFRVSETGMEMPPIAIDSITPANGDTFSVQFNRSISEQAWTTVQHLVTDDSIRIGVLPGDVNADGISDSRDVASLIKGLSDPNIPRTTLFFQSLDIDRNFSYGPSDVLRLIDLLNGAGEYQVYYGVSLP